ncbi:MAG: hypothetical protein GEU95_09455 [Rhizobiales bacterium]|nr:hypothetical protein [Hyphomicrobiales bacterium]
MATTKQRTAAKKNIKKAHTARHSMSSQPEGRRRSKPGTSGQGEFFHIEVRPTEEFEIFRTQDVGRQGGIERVAGKRGSGSWHTQKWMISKDHAHLDDGRLVPDTDDAREVLKELGSLPRHVDGDRFKAEPRPNVPESEKPTPAQQQARHRNIQKAQAARHGS